ncbi:MAG: DNA-directed RNA polymerase subunit B, partial [Candidatus Heimdallarchaeota archaeon]
MSETEKITIEDRWKLIESMVNELGLVRQHLDSYNEFIQNGMQNVVREIGSIKPEIPNYYVKINKIDMEPPNTREADGSINTIYPSEARIRNLTYTAQLFLEMTPIRIDEAGNEIPRETSRVYVGRMPIM